MVIIRTRSASEGEAIIKKLKKMHKFTKELLDCVEEKYEDEDEDDGDYRDDMEYDYPHERRGGSRGRYRRGM